MTSLDDPGTIQAMDEKEQCLYIGGANKYAKRRCTHAAVEDGYCRRHASHPERRNERALALIWEHRNQMAEQILNELSQISLNPEESTGDRIRAAIGYLDRTGHGPNQAMSDEEAARVARATIDLMRDEGTEDDPPA